MGIAVAIAVFVLLWLGYSFYRASSRLRRGARQLDEAWQEVEEALRQRDRALEEFAAALARLGLVPRGREALAEALSEIRRARAEGPVALAEADDRLNLVLREIYGALPRSRPAELKEAQNALAEAEEELDLSRRHYNELVAAWNALFARWSYRRMADRLDLGKREFYLLPGEEAEFIRQQGPLV